MPDGLADDAVAITVEPAPDGCRVTAIAVDRIGLLADLAAMFALQRVPVRAARAWAQGRYAVSVWEVADEYLDPAILRTRFEGIVDGRIDPGERLRPADASVLAPTVVVHPEASEQATVLEVRAADRPGVVHLVCAALAGARRHGPLRARRHARPPGRGRVLRPGGRRPARCRRRAPRRPRTRCAPRSPEKLCLPGADGRRYARGWMCRGAHRRPRSHLGKDHHVRTFQAAPARHRGRRSHPRPGRSRPAPPRPAADEPPSTPVPISTPDGLLMSYVLNAKHANPGQIQLVEARRRARRRRHRPVLAARSASWSPTPTSASFRADVARLRRQRRSSPSAPPGASPSPRARPRSRAWGPGAPATKRAEGRRRGRRHRGDRRPSYPTRARPSSGTCR